MSEKKVFAVVVTYKRAKILKTCLESVLNLSTYKISRLHVILNSMEEDSWKVIKDFQISHQGIISYEKHDNCGPAGGFYHGLQRFLESNCDFVWLMDDDVVPEPSCLRELVKCTDQHPYVLAKTLKRGGEQVLSFGWWGVLLARDVVLKVGLPLKDFFYWTEDTEYLQNRIAWKFQIAPFRSNEAVVTHLHERNALRPDWFYYYTVRNTLYYRLRIFPLNKRGVFRLLNLFFGSGYRILFREENKTRKLYLMFLGCRHAFRGKLGKLNIEH